MLEKYAVRMGGGSSNRVGSVSRPNGADSGDGQNAADISVEAGKYITDNVYLEVIGGGEGGAAVKVEWQPRRNIAVASQFGGQGDTSLSIRWRRESRPPGEQRDRRPNRR